MREINHLRSRLGMPLVDARLNDFGVAVEGDAKPKPAKAKSTSGHAKDHTEAREIYQGLLSRRPKCLKSTRPMPSGLPKRRRVTARRPSAPWQRWGPTAAPSCVTTVASRSFWREGSSTGCPRMPPGRRTPATNGPPGFTEAWFRRNPELNNTLRIYHGYPGRDDNQCCNVASREDRRARAEFGVGKGREKQKLILAFIEDEFPDMVEQERLDLLTLILDTMYSLRPRPRGQSPRRPSRQLRNLRTRSAQAPPATPPRVVAHGVGARDRVAQGWFSPAQPPANSFLARPAVAIRRHIGQPAPSAAHNTATGAPVGARRAEEAAEEGRQEMTLPTHPTRRSLGLIAPPRWGTWAGAQELARREGHRRFGGETEAAPAARRRGVPGSRLSRGITTPCGELIDVIDNWQLWAEQGFPYRSVMTPDRDSIKLEDTLGILWRRKREHRPHSQGHHSSRTPRRREERRS